MKVTFGIMGVQALKIQNKAKRSGESICFTFLRGATHIGREVSEQALREGKLEVETSLGKITIAVDQRFGADKADENGIWAPCNIQGRWTIREYYRILTELVNNHGFTTPTGGLFWKMPEWLDGWVKDGLIDPE